MKKLTRVKLINWHRFVNATIDLEKSTLISGENGAGKSTLLDAIQFVIICSTNYFNKAAHENGKRKLTGYIRCKTGRENKPYERTGEISAHVALEFYEEKKDKYFVIGAVVDSASEGQEKTARYLMDGVRFEDSMFFQGNARVSFFIDPRNTSPFVNYDAGGKTGVQQCLDVIAKDHWSEDNRNIYAFWPRLSPTLVENNMQTSTWWMHDGSFIRLKTVELGYTFSQKALKKIGVQSLRLYLTGSNLLTFSKFKLWDAEMGNNGLGYPIQRVYNLGININF